MNKHLENYTTHLNELKKRVIFSLIAFLLGSIFCFFLAKQLFQFLIYPLTRLDADKHLIFTGLTEMFNVYLEIAVYGGFVLALPFILYQLYQFLAPGLYNNEKRILLPYLVASPILFILGSLLAYFLITPLAWKFFLSFEIPSFSGQTPITLEPRVSEYLSLVISLIMAFGLAFQLPLLITLLVLMGVIKTSSLIKKRRIAIMVIFIIAAIITPPDAISQIALAIPLILLYELSILVSKKLESDNDSTA